MAGLLTRSALTVTRFRQPRRFKSWCEKETNKEATVKQASQESVFKDYDLNQCKKTVVCPKTRLDCNQPPRAPPPCKGQKKKMTGTDLLGKMVWIGIKGGILAGLVYVTIDAGVWKGPDETQELGKAMYKRMRELFGLDDPPPIPTAGEIIYNTVQVWNKGVRIIFNRIAHPYVDYETYMARRLKASRERLNYKQ